MSTDDNEARTHIRRWLERILELRRWNAADLARRAGISPSTIGRALKGEKFIMTTVTLTKIAEAGQIAIPAELTGAARGFAEPEAEPFVGKLDDDMTEADNLDRWQIKGRGLELIGYLPGDVVLVSRLEKPRAGDVVHAQIYDQHGSAETVFRSYEQPYLTTRTADPGSHRRPQLVDDERVMIVGVITKMVRLRT